MALRNSSRSGHARATSRRAGAVQFADKPSPRMPGRRSGSSSKGPIIHFMVAQAPGVMRQLGNRPFRRSAGSTGGSGEISLRAFKLSPRPRLAPTLWATARTTVPPSDNLALTAPATAAGRVRPPPVRQQAQAQYARLAVAQGVGVDSFDQVIAGGGNQNCRCRHAQRCVPPAACVIPMMNGSTSVTPIRPASEYTPALPR